MFTYGLFCGDLLCFVFWVCLSPGGELALVNLSELTMAGCGNEANGGCVREECCIGFSYLWFRSELGAAASVRLLFLVTILLSVSRISIPFYDIIILCFFYSLSCLSLGIF